MGPVSPDGPWEVGGIDGDGEGKKEEEDVVLKTDVIYFISDERIMHHDKGTYLRSNNSRRPRWTHLTLETLLEINSVNR